MDFKHSHRMPTPAPKLENGFFGRVLGLLVAGVIRGRKEVSRRQLFRIAHDDGLFASQHRTQGVLGTHLRGLVYDKKVEVVPARLKILCDRHRAHHDTRRVRADGVTRIGEQPA